MRTRIKNITLNSLLVIGSVLMLLTVTELILRHTEYAHIPLTGIYTYPPDYFIADEQAGYDIAPNKRNKIHNMPDYRYELFSNSLGCYDYERPVPDDYALVIGDSATWGYTPLDYKWTTKLEQLSGQFLLKCGVTGYGTKQELMKAKKVVQAVGKNPKYIIVMYIFNDMNDDFLVPQRTTIYDGIMVTLINTYDLDTGKIIRRPKSELEKMFEEYNNPFNKAWNNIRSDLVIYRCYRKALEAAWPAIKKLFAPRQKQNFYPNNPAAAIPVGMPSGKSVEGGFIPILIDYLNEYQRPWYNDVVNAHQANLIALINYAKSINAKLLFIDEGGHLSHKRFKAFRSQFNDYSLAYYRLNDTPKYTRWPHDGHWDIKGNQRLGEDIYKYTQDIHFFEDKK